MGGSMRRAALAAWHAGRQHAAASAGRDGMIAARLSQLQQPQPGHPWCVSPLQCVSTAASDLSSSSYVLGTWQSASPSCGSPLPRPAAHCSPVRLASSHRSAALLHSGQVHIATANGFSAAAVSQPLSGHTTPSTPLPKLYSRSPQAPGSQLGRTVAAGTTADGTLRYRAYASRAAQALTKGHAAGPGTQQQGSIRISVASPNQIAEPYTGTPPKLPFLRSWFTPAGWRARWARGTSGAKSMYTVRACKKQLPGFSIPSFKAEALKTYSAVCASLASGNVNALRQLTTGDVFSEMKKELRNREAAGWTRVAWGLAQKPALNEMAVVHGRLIYLNPKDDSSAFAQLTVRLQSTQRFAAYDARGRLLAGDPDAHFPVTDLWVFEMSLRKSVANRWRLAARLNPALK